MNQQTPPRLSAAAFVVLTETRVLLTLEQREPVDICPIVDWW